MLSIGKLRAGQEGYYLATVAPSAADYYLGRGEAPGRWTGAGAALAGLGGEVNGDALGVTLAGPGTAANRKVAGFDLTFSAPKSVSVLWAIGDDVTSAEATAAHERAVDGALGYLERHATFTRLRVDGRLEHLAGEGLTVAAFRHRTSRAGDPQLHTHCLVVNSVRAVAGGAGALDGRSLYAHARTAGFVYQAVLRGELTERLGVSWNPVRQGTAEVAGVPRPVLEEFSRRRAEVEARLAERGRSSAAAAQAATLFTRRPKEMVPVAGLHEQWAERAAALGVTSRSLEAVLGRDGPPGARAQRGRVGARLAGPEGLTATDSAFDRRSAMRAWCESLAPGTAVDAAELDGLADGLLADGAVVRLAGEAPETVRRADGVVLAGGPDRRRFSTAELLDVERSLLHAAEARRSAEAGVVGEERLAAVLGARPSLGGEQVEMVRRLTTSGAGVDVVVGVAGAGKTYALGAARQAWEGAGHRVSGVALAARAAAELQAGSGIASTTLARLLLDLERPEAGLGRRSVVVVDEAATVDTRRLAALLGHAERAGAKVVLVGDHRQLPEIAAGGAFRALAERLGATELVENRRQREPWEREALGELRAGEVALAVAAYGNHHRLVQAEDGEALRSAMVGDWAEARARGESCLLVAVGNADVADLNRRARQHLIDTGAVGGLEVAAGGRAFAVGDDVLCLRNDWRIGVTNGSLGSVLGVRSVDGSLVVRFEDRTVELPAVYVGDELSHGYATTVHKAQGRTVDSAFVLGDDRLYREAGYVGLSRGREDNRVYAVAAEADTCCEALDRSTERADAVQDLAGALERSAAKHVALEELVRVEEALVSVGPTGLDELEEGTELDGP